MTDEEIIAEVKETIESLRQTPDSILGPDLPLQLTIKLTREAIRKEVLCEDCEIEIYETKEDIDCIFEVLTCPRCGKKHDGAIPKFDGELIE